MPCPPAQASRKVLEVGAHQLLSKPQRNGAALRRCSARALRLHHLRLPDEEPPPRPALGLGLRRDPRQPQEAERAWRDPALQRGTLAGCLPASASWDPNALPLRGFASSRNPS